MIMGFDDNLSLKVHKPVIKRVKLKHGLWGGGGKGVTSILFPLYKLSRFRYQVLTSARTLGTHLLPATCHHLFSAPYEVYNYFVISTIFKGTSGNSRIYELP